MLKKFKVYIILKCLTSQTKFNFFFGFFLFSIGDIVFIYLVFSVVGAKNLRKFFNFQFYFGQIFASNKRVRNPTQNKVT